MTPLPDDHPTDARGRRIYTQQFKDQASVLVLRQGYTRVEAARKLGISAKTLANWVLERRPAVTPTSPAAQVEDQDDPAELRRRIRELETQLRRAETEREILKRATAFFAREDEQIDAQDHPRGKR